MYAKVKKIIINFTLDITIVKVKNNKKIDHYACSFIRRSPPVIPSQSIQCVLSLHA